MSSAVSAATRKLAASLPRTVPERRIVGVLDARQFGTLLGVATRG